MLSFSTFTLAVYHAASSAPLSVQLGPGWSITTFVDSLDDVIKRGTRFNARTTMYRWRIKEQIYVNREEKTRQIEEMMERWCQGVVRWRFARDRQRWRMLIYDNFGIPKEQLKLETSHANIYLYFARWRQKTQTRLNKMTQKRENDTKA